MISITGPRVAQEMTRVRSSEPGSVTPKDFSNRFKGSAMKKLIQPFDIFDGERIVSAQRFTDFLPHFGRDCQWKIACRVAGR